MEKNYKIYVAIPAYGGMISSRTVKGLLDMQSWFLDNSIKMYLNITFNESLITRARNELVADMLSNDFFATHILFIDSDIGFNHKNIERLITADKEIVCGVYPKKHIYWDQAKKAILENPEISSLELERKSLNYAVNFFENNIKIDNGYSIVKDAATGMMLVKREVFLKLIDYYPDRKYIPSRHESGIKLNNTYDFFSVGAFSKEDRTYLSEDYYFSRLWQKSGGQIWADLFSPLTHTGSYNFKGNFYSKLDLDSK